MAAPSRFTPEIRGALLERFAAGLTVEDTARAVGVNTTTLKRWLARGRKESGTDYAEFAAAVDDARKKAADRPEPMDREELARVVSQAARRGNVQAMKLRDEMLLRDEQPVEDDEPKAPELGSIDELAERRAAHAAG